MWEPRVTAIRPQTPPGVRFGYAQCGRTPRVSDLSEVDEAQGMLDRLEINSILRPKEQADRAAREALLTQLAALPETSFEHVKGNAQARAQAAVHLAQRRLDRLNELLSEVEKRRPG
jgi:hypothetical protein